MNFRRAAVQRDAVPVAHVSKTGHTVAFGEFELFAERQEKPIAQEIRPFAVLPGSASAFNRSDQR